MRRVYVRTQPAINGLRNGVSKIIGGTLVAYYHAMARRLKPVALWATPAVHQAMRDYAAEHGHSISHTVLLMLYGELCAESAPPDHPLFAALREQLASRG
jgi:hypothetical protein